MKKVLFLATAAFLVATVSFANDGDKKAKAKKECTKDCKDKDCCKKKDAKTATAAKPATAAKTAMTAKPATAAKKA